MDLGTILAVLTAAATALTAGLLVWDRIEKMRLPTPLVEMGIEQTMGEPTAVMVFTIRNTAPVSARLWRMELLKPAGTVFVRKDHADSAIANLSQETEPGHASTLRVRFRLPVTLEGEAALKAMVHVAFTTSKVSRRRITISRQVRQHPKASAQQTSKT